MSKGSASEQELGKLHFGLTKLFTKILKGYELKLAALDRIIEASDPEDALVDELMSLNIEPSPAMLSAISKFLKDNEISADNAELDQLSAHEERLKNKKANRPILTSITNLKVV